MTVVVIVTIILIHYDDSYINNTVCGDSDGNDVYVERVNTYEFGKQCDRAHQDNSDDEA